MLTRRTEAKTSEGALWGRLIQPTNGTFPQAAARAVLAINFTETDKARMHDLAQRNGEGKLSLSEIEELGTYIKVANVLALLHAKARRSLKKR
jgi:hypothetical protein